MARRSVAWKQSANALRQKSPISLAPYAPSRQLCLQVPDYTRVTHSAVDFFGLRNSSNPLSQAARLADQFIAQNSGIFELMKVQPVRDYDGTDVLLSLESAGAVGAVPLRSPLTGRFDFGLVVQPRFPWKGIGPMLAEMGWLISPSLLRLPQLRRSERTVPLWVISYTVLTRLKRLLEMVHRSFEMITELRSAPKGAVELDPVRDASNAARTFSVGPVHVSGPP